MFLFLLGLDNKPKPHKLFYSHRGKFGICSTKQHRKKMLRGEKHF